MPVMARATNVCLAATALWMMIGTSRGEEAYIVKRGDTLFSIARSHEVALDDLADRNGLSHGLHLSVGQHLVIPDARAKKVSAASVAKLPRSIQRAIDRAPVRPGRWQYIVIHHSAVDTGTVKAMDQYHREVRHMENGLAYDFVIGNGSGMGDGEIGVGPRWTKQLDGGHLASEAQNKIALGICLVGNFDEHKPTPRQVATLRALIYALMRRCDLTRECVKTHRQINIVHTRCPGSEFPTTAFLESLREADTPGR
jgi:LysM repeat protein